VGRRTANTTESPGYDSFLDIVANLIGILIILIMVVGVRAKDAFVTAAAENPAAAEEAIEPEPIDIQAPAQEAAAVEADIHRINRAMKQVEHEAEIRRRSRDTTYAMLTSLEQEIEQEKTQLDEAQRARVELNADLQQASAYLDQLDAQREALSQEAAAPEVLPHVPTPMAKTVFGREEHFRLEHGRLAYVPWETLVEQFQVEARQKMYKLRGVPRFTDEFGPIGGYRVRYTLKNVRRTLDTGGVTMTQEGVELDRILMLPVRDDLGDPADKLFVAGSDFRARLESWDPRKTTITVWVYPDSFEEFRQLKTELYQLGFMTAARPMPAGEPIGGAPNGTRSSAQ
jgi:hypothetical protein